MRKRHPVLYPIVCYVSLALLLLLIWRLINLHPAPRIDTLTNDQRAACIDRSGRWFAYVSPASTPVPTIVHDDAAAVAV